MSQAALPCRHAHRLIDRLGVGIALLAASALFAPQLQATPHQGQGGGQQADARSVRPADLPQAEVRHLFERAAKGAERAYRESLRSTDEGGREEARAHYLSILNETRSCTAARDFVQAEPRTAPRSLVALLRRTIAAERSCRIEIASLLLQRLDQHPVESERRFMRLIAATHLDAGGVSSGRQLLIETYAELAATNATGRWSYLFEALSTYRDTPAWHSYLDFVADRIATEGERRLPDGMFNGLHLVFAAADRCDLVKQVYASKNSSFAPAPRKSPGEGRPQAYSPPVAPAPPAWGYSCAAGKAKHARLLSEGARLAKDYKERFGPQEPSLNRIGLDQALSHPDPRDRLFYLRSFVEKLRSAVVRRAPAGS